MKTLFRIFACVGVLIAVVSYMKSGLSTEEATYSIALMIFIYIANLEKCDE